MNQVSEWAKNQYDEARQKDAALANIDMYIEQLQKNVKAVSYAMLVFTMIIGLTFIVGYCYRESTLDRTFLRREKRKMESDL